jgi:hypothetical protein
MPAADFSAIDAPSLWRLAPYPDVGPPTPAFRQVTAEDAGSSNHGRRTELLLPGYLCPHIPV